MLPDDIAAAAAALVADYEQTGDTNLRMLALEERVPAVAEGLASGAGATASGWSASSRRPFPTFGVRTAGAASPSF